MNVRTNKNGVTTKTNVKEALKNYHLLMSFMKGDPRIFDGIRWDFSLNSKMGAIEILLKDVLAQIPKALEEEKMIREKGFGDGIEAHTLAIKYEVFLNSIYSFCENLGYIAWCLLKKKIPRHFNEQKKSAQAGKMYDANYSELVKSSWYGEIHLMRSESTHYLSGFVSYSDGTKLGYFNKPKSERGKPPAEIKVDNIEEHVKILFESLIQFLIAFGDHFITLLNSTSRVYQVCLFNSGRIGVRLISLKEYLNGESGECQTKAFDCPEKNVCKARK